MKSKTLNPGTLSPRPETAKPKTAKSKTLNLGTLSPKPEVVNDPVNNPRHYTQHPSGVECIQITEHMSFNLGNAVKYIWRSDLKADAVEDLRKARWYLDREISRRTRGAA